MACRLKTLTIVMIYLSIKMSLSKIVAPKRHGDTLTFINWYKCTGNAVNAFSSVAELIEYMVTDYQNPNGYLRNKPYKVIMKI